MGSLTFRDPHPEVLDCNLKGCEALWRKRAEYPKHLLRLLNSYCACSPETFSEYFLSCLPGNFALKKGRDFWWIFLVSVYHETKHENSSKNSAKIRSKIRGKISGRKFEKFGELSFCNFSDLLLIPKDPSRTKNTTDSKFTTESKFATAIVKHYGGHFETTIFKGKVNSKSLQTVKIGARKGT